MITADTHRRRLEEHVDDCRQPLRSLLTTRLEQPLIKPPEIIRAEANFLRFPLFALHTKGLRHRDGIDCVGRKHVGDQVRLFKLSITRNTKHLYPGPLSRKTHVALLSLQQEGGLPYENPVTWTWRQLAERMDVSCGGEIEAKLKDAIRRTAGILITTNYALTATVGDERHLLPADEHGYHLYDGYRFRNEQLHDGTLADGNCVWLSDWYLNNLNSLYSGPLHHPTWLSLEAHSGIASRLYEFLLFNAKATDCLRIDYATLASFLPIKLERYPSDAERQLAEPLRFAREHNVIDDVTWTLGRRGQMQLVIRLGSRLCGASPSAMCRHTEWPDFADDVEIRELRNAETPAAAIVREFHRLWSGNHNYRPTRSELEWANLLMERYGGRSRVKKLLPKVVRVMQRPDGFPNARMFTASRPYFDDIATQDARERQRRHDEQKRAVQEEIENDQTLNTKRTRKRRRDELMAIWTKLPIDKKAKIEQDTFQRQQGTVLRELYGKSESHRLRECLKELDRQIQENVS